MLRRLPQILLLSFVLLFAQQAVAWHALSHHGKTSHTQQDKKSTHNEQCAQCTAHAQLGAACGSAVPSISLLSLQQEQSTRPIAAQPRFRPGVYRSRAPPLPV